MDIVGAVKNTLYRAIVTDPANYWTGNKSAEVKISDTAGVYAAAAAWPVWMLLGSASCSNSKPTTPPPPPPTPDAAVMAPDAAVKIPDAARPDAPVLIDTRAADGLIDAMPRQDILGGDSFSSPDNSLDTVVSLDAFIGRDTSIESLPALDTMIDSDLAVGETAPPDAGNSICPALLPPTANPLINDDLNSLNSSLWSASNWANGGVFNVGWRPDHLLFNGGLMTIQLDNAGCPSGCSNMPYASGELRSQAHYGYGLLEGRIKPPTVSGVVSSLFIYTGPSDNGNPWDEIDIEFPFDPKNPTRPVRIQFNYIANGAGGHEQWPDLGFDPSQDFHEYAIRWTRDAICWYVDRQLVPNTQVYAKNTPLPVTAGQIMMNLWTGTDAETTWIGPLASVPVVAQYDWVRFTPAN
jgi:endo-1,3-1,4-beta-glycanase ExoK